MSIKAPYNFVPLNEKVVFPEWADDVSHDIPFDDGETASIEIEIEAKSPLFVKNSNRNTNPENHLDFFSHNNKYYIPGSSIKGMLRNVLEIMTFSKMSQVKDHKYSFRDFQNTKDLYPILSLSKQINCGWLRYDINADKYYLKNCDKPGRIPHHWIKTKNFNGEEKFRKYFLQGGGFSNKDDQKSAKFKYEKYFGDIGNFDYEKLQFYFTQKKYGKDNEVDKREFFEISEVGKKGTIIFTGQPGPRIEPEKGSNKKPNGKIHEFIFFDRDNNEFEVPEKVIETFFFAYFDFDKARQSDDWKFWKNKLDMGVKIPVFFRFDGNSEKIKDMGLSYLYKITYEMSVKDTIKIKDHAQKHKLDFVETLFGYISEEHSLKGRVHIGHAKSTIAEKENKIVGAALSSPKASYYPNYIEQENQNINYKTYNNGIIRGRKRYPIHSDGVKESSTGNDKMDTKFIPIKSASKFKFSIHFHNLRKIEIGALLSAITFHKTDGCYHSVGMAKPLGYGKVKLNIVEHKDLNHSIEVYLKAFEAYMNSKLGYSTPKWHQNKCLNELIAMATEQKNSDASELRYMIMNINGNNEFIIAKKEKMHLKNYSLLVNSNKTICSLISPSEIQTNQILSSKSSALEQKKINILIEAKSQLLDFIKKKDEELNCKSKDLREQIEAKITEINKLQRRLSVSTGPDFSNFDISNKDAFKKFRKEIEIYSTKKFGKTNYKKIIEENPNGVLDLNSINELFELLGKIISNTKSKTRPEDVEKIIKECFGSDGLKMWIERD